MFFRIALLIGLLSGCRPPPPETPAPEPVPSPPPEPEPEPEPEPPSLEEDPTPDGAACQSNGDCRPTQHCRGPVGCEEPSWACGQLRICGPDLVAFCDCQGETFYAQDNCPGRPFASVGPCPHLGPEDVEEVSDHRDHRLCQSSADCRPGYVCSGIQGCGTFWTCVRRRRLRCAQAGRSSFCGCDGETFTASTRCPGRPVMHRGACAIAEAEAPTEEETRPQTETEGQASSPEEPETEPEPPTPPAAPSPAPGPRISPRQELGRP